MNDQVRSILWAQFRTVRNRLPRTGAGAILLGLVSCFWYGCFAVLAFTLAVALPAAPTAAIRAYLPAGLLAMLLFWQLFPLMTLSSGWTLDLDKLLIYPIRNQTLFTVELLLRVTTAPEMIIVLAGLIIGLARNPGIAAILPFSLLLYLAFNLFLSLGIRETVRRAFSRRRLRELLFLFIVVISVLPSVVFNTSLGERGRPFFFAAANARFTPWYEFGSLATGRQVLVPFAISLLLLLVAYAFAKRQFERTISSEVTASAIVARRAAGPSGKTSLAEGIYGFPSRIFPDPLAALIEKEFRVLSRSPRFRVIFGMACLFSFVVFFPLAFGRAANTFFANNYLPSISAYGLLIVGETLLWNMFGFDRKATQIYYLSPVRMATVIRAKNLVAVAVICLMMFVVTAISCFIPSQVSTTRILGSVLLTFVLTVFFLSFGNFTSVMLPRPIDPNQAMRNQNSAKGSLLLLVCLLTLAVPVGLAMAARWAFDAEWPYFAVLGADFLIGLAVYEVTTEWAVERAESDREQILEALSRGSDPIGS